MRIYGFYNQEGVYPNLLRPIYEEDGTKYTQVIENDEVQYYSPIDTSEFNQEHMYYNTSTNNINPNNIIYAFMTKGKTLYCSDKHHMQKTVRDNLTFVDDDSPVYDSLRAFAYAQDSAQ